MTKAALTPGLGRRRHKDQKCEVKLHRVQGQPRLHKAVLRVNIKATHVSKLTTKPTGSVGGPCGMPSPADTYLHIPFEEGLRDPQHVGILHQFQQVLSQLLLVLGDFSELHLELLQLFLQ